MHHAGLHLDLPLEFSADQTMVSFRAPPPVKPDARVIQRQTAIRTSFIVHRRDVGSDAGLGILAGEVTAELVSSVAGLSAMTTESIAFRDGAPGIVIGFDFGAPEVGTARQFHALRKDGAVLTTLTLTVDKMTLNNDKKTHWFTLLQSAVPHGNGALL